MDIKILIVDDDINICELMSLYLLKDGYAVKMYHSGEKVINEVVSYKPDLIILDVMLPVKDGYQVLREIRENEKTSKIPVIMLTAKSETFDKVLGLELGADDYMVKPFESKELVARVHAVLRRYKTGNELDKQENSDSIISIPNMTIDEIAYLVTYKDREYELPPKEFELLTFFVKHPNRVFTREQLLDKIWGFDFLGDTRTVDVHIKRLREKFNEEDWGIKTIWGVGYKFELKKQ